jgi:hypothetical protein
MKRWGVRMQGDGYHDLVVKSKGISKGLRNGVRGKEYLEALCRREDNMSS